MPIIIIELRHIRLHKESLYASADGCLNNRKQAAIYTHWSQHHFDWYVITDLLQKLPSLKETFDLKVHTHYIVNIF